MEQVGMAVSLLIRFRLLYGPLNGHASIETTQMDGRMNDELESIWKEAVWTNRGASTAFACRH
jgi:hypothetical protein